MKSVTERIRILDGREITATSYTDDPMDVAMQVMAHSTAGYCASRHGIPVAVGGLTPSWPGVLTTWMWATPKVGDVGMELTRFSRNLIKLMLQSDEVHRIQAFSADFHTEAHRWMLAIGLRHETTMKEYGKNGEDFHVFSALRGKNVYIN